MPVGVEQRADGSCEFAVWAPRHKSVKLHLFGSAWQAATDAPANSGDHSNERYIEMERNNFGYFRATVENISPDSRYMYQLNRPENGRLNGMERPDPASRFQPEGVHRASPVVDLGSFSWTDQSWEAPGFMKCTLEHTRLLERSMLLRNSWRN
jgi:maltooligosyltrehalose trehalohydrolase